MNTLTTVKNHRLDNLNTLRLKSSASGFVVLEHIEQLPNISNIIKQYDNKFFVLGGGSNIILPELYSGIVIQNKLLGIEVLNDCDIDTNNIDDTANSNNLNEYTKVRVMAGVNWDFFVAYSLEHGLFGLENLSLIPGTVGAAPIQNIGAYGVEVKDFIDYVEAYDINARKIVILHNSECGFRYRDSIFKHEANSHYIIIAVIFKLLRVPQLNCSYGDVKHQMASLNNPTAIDLRQCIIKIRQSKLPDPAKIGNVGSFFHNPIVENDKITLLQQAFPDISVHAVDANNAKISAGWLIDNLGLKGYREDNLGIYEKQALVIVNYTGTETDTGAAVTQSDVLLFAKMVQDKVYTKYKINLNIEPIIVK